MRLVRIISATVLFMAGLATPGWAQPAAHGTPPAGWQVNGDQLVWTAPGQVPVGDAAIEFWTGDRLLGRPRLVG